MPQKEPPSAKIKIWEALLKILQNPAQQGPQSVLQLQTALLEDFGIHTKKDTIYTEINRLTAHHFGVKIEVRRQGPKKKPTNFYYFQPPTP